MCPGPGGLEDPGADMGPEVIGDCGIPGNSFIRWAAWAAWAESNWEPGETEEARSAETWRELHRERERERELLQISQLKYGHH